jgi:hypothetical protein
MLYRTQVYYNNFNLSGLPGIAVYNHNFISMPARNLNRAKLARADRSILTSAEYSEKTITVTGIATGDTKNEIEGNFETLKGVLQVPEGIIRVEQAGQQVEYTGTLSAFSTEFLGKHLKFTLSFLCSNPIGRSRLTSTLLDEVTSSASYTHSITVEGSYKALPIIRITFSALTGGTNKTVQVLNADTGQGISITRDWTAGEILTVDSFNKRVEVDDADVDYGGVFPSFYPGLRSFQYIDDLTTRTVAIEITYNKQYA